MALAPGAKLDGYEILGLLGSGGMGEVYRARDPVLKRDVAIKVLPSFVSRNPEELRRFEQEAQAAAALNHPNILAVYRFGVFEGAPYLVSELLDGSTLRELFERGPLPLRKAIELGVQTAHGLAAAHEKGIVHRDLKPENLFVTKDGRVKILDFGLAKLTHPEPAPDGETQTRGTNPGTVMGTVGYMAPEQVRGTPADHRADIFAFGATLYEMLTGKRAFRKPTSAETMAAILNEDPPAVSQVVSATPLGLQRVVHRCMEKNPEQRFQSASDLAFALEAAAESGSSSGTGVVQVKRPVPRIAILWTLTVAVLVLAAVRFYFSRPKEKVPFEHFSIQNVIDSKHVLFTAISPDGAYLASVIRNADGKQDIWIHNIPTGSERPILQDVPYKFHELIFSPDGSYIYFVTVKLLGGEDEPNELYRMPVLGGRPARVLTSVDASISFIDGGRRLCFIRTNFAAETYQILSTGMDGSDERVLVKALKPLPWAATCVPDGRSAILAIDNRFETIDFASGLKRQLGPPMNYGDYDLPWAPDGKGFFVIVHGNQHNGQLGFLSYPDGKFRQLTNDLSNYRAISVTADGQTIAATTYAYDGRFATLSLVASSQFVERPPEDIIRFTWLDDSRIAESSYGAAIKIVDLVKNDTTMLSFSKDVSYGQISRCDSDSLVAVGTTASGDDAYPIYRVPLDGSRPTRLTKGTSGIFPLCSADGKWLYYVDQAGAYKAYLTRRPLQGGDAQRLVEFGAPYDLSPDGKAAARVDLSASPPRIQIVSTESLKEIQSVPLPRDAPHAYLAFSTDGKSLFFNSRAGEDSTLWRQPLDAAAPIKVAILPGKSVVWMRPSPDGKRLGLSLSSPTSEAVLLHEVH
jgi:serine/threonine protein kinase